MGNRMSRMLTLVVAGIVFIGMFGSSVYAEEAPVINVYFEGELLKFEDTEPIIKNSRTLVPFRKIFETLGFEIEWIDGKIRKAIGKKDGLTIELTIDSNLALVNGKTVELDVPAQILNGRTLVPVRFISENSGYQVGYDRVGHVSSIEIGPPFTLTPDPTKPDTTKPVTTDPDANKVEPFVMKGRVTNKQGQPLADVQVYADNRLLLNSNLITYTDENGYYRIDVSEIQTTWSPGAKLITEYEGAEYTFYLKATVDRPFATNDGAVRDFVTDGMNGWLSVYSREWGYSPHENAPEFDIEDVEVTMTPVSILIDGSKGEVIKGKALSHYNGNGFRYVPVGRYEITARWAPKGYEAIPMRVSIRHEDDFGDSVITSFNEQGETLYYIHIEVEFAK